MTDVDIVTRLRKFAREFSFTDTHSDFSLTEAADEIERLRNERAAFEAERDELIRIYNKLKFERDEARREVCEYEAGEIRHRHDINAAYMAALRGWDCFKEDTNG